MTDEDRRRTRRAIVLRWSGAGALLLALLLAALHGREARAQGVNLVRLEGVLGVQNAPGNIVQITLAIGAKSVPYSVTAAQRVSGEPMNGPGILLALGPGPPPLRIEGPDAMVKELLTAPAGSRAVITGSLQVGMAFLTLMSAEITPSAGAQ